MVTARAYHKLPNDAGVDGPQLSRLETRTKESNVRASGRVANLTAKRKRRLFIRLRYDAAAPGPWLQYRPILMFTEGFEVEHVREDPKDSELCVRSVKPGEILVEARSDTDVQIVRLTRV